MNLSNFDKELNKAPPILDENYFKPKINDYGKNITMMQFSYTSKPAGPLIKSSDGD